MSRHDDAFMAAMFAMQDREDRNLLAALEQATDVPAWAPSEQQVPPAQVDAWDDWLFRPEGSDGR